jgi:thiamine pyrophosphokinase
VTRVVVFAGGEDTPPEAIADLSRDVYVIAADSGAAHAERLGWRVDRLVGDLDSAEPALVDRLRTGGTRVDRHPAAKDQTDLALALDVAMEREPLTVTVVGGHGGRLDHFLANALLLASDDYAGAALDARMGHARLTVVRGRRELVGARHSLLSLLATGAPASGVSTEGLLFPLHDAVLRPGSSRGVSNQLTGERATVSVGRGVLLAVQPGQTGVLR